MGCAVVHYNEVVDELFRPTAPQTPRQGSFSPEVDLGDAALLTP
jgi:hypothetical protein